MPPGRILVADQPGNHILPELAPIRGETVINKPGKGIVWATGVQETLPARGLTQLVFAGVTTEFCVQTSMREANDRGYECLLVGRDRKLFCRVQGRRDRDDRGVGRIVS